MQKTVTYTLSRDDYVEMTAALLARPVWQRFVILAVILGLWFGAVMVFAGGGLSARETLDLLFSPSLRLPIGSFLVLTMVFVLFAHRVNALNAHFLYAKLFAADSEIVLDFTETGLKSKVQGVEASFPWSAIGRVIALPDRFLLCISKREAITVPKRAFPDETAYRETLAFAVARSKLDDRT